MLDLPPALPFPAIIAGRICAPVDIDQIPNAPLFYIEKAQHPVFIDSIEHYIIIRLLLKYLVD
ncbi:MAG: hypothetical protein A2W76_11730 [Gammaproteobacteria bacterium RIFCSPLOWO2_12_47_11]|nr:MAG: hypothetical protein A2W76_11730 [Gammaproteobacteria bacterium RIFCSPLOWO2_12_47_11]